jgi:ribosome-associated protein
MEPLDPKPAPDTKTIRLDQLLKLRRVATSGGHAKSMIQAGQVKVNGTVEERRGRKLRAGDVVELRGNAITVDDALLAQSDASDGEGKGEGEGEGEPSA